MRSSTPAVCAPTALISDGKKICHFGDANITTQGFTAEVLLNIPVSILP